MSVRTVLKDVLYIIIFSTFWYFLIFIWYWLDGANGPNMLFDGPPNFEIFETFRDEFLKVSSDQNFLAAEIIVFIILIFTIYKLFSFLVIIFQLLFICTFIFTALLLYFDSIDTTMISDFVIKSGNDFSVMLIGQFYNFNILHFLNRFYELGNISFMVLHAHIFAVYDIILSYLAYFSTYSYTHLTTSLRQMIKTVLNLVAEYLEKLADAI
jgi:hypothetical protein